MKPEMLKTGMICKDSPHPAHRGFAESIGADIIDLKGLPSPWSGSTVEDLRHGLRFFSIPSSYDIYIAEGSSDLYPLPLLSTHTDAKFIFLYDDHRLFGMDAYHYGKSPMQRMAKNIDRSLDLHVLRWITSEYVDAIVAGSSLTADCVNSIVGSEVPCEIVNPYIQPDVYRRLASVTPELKSNIVVTVGVSRGHKGVDRLISIWKNIRDSVSDAELYVVGPGYPEQYDNVPGVTLTGYVDPSSLHQILERASVYIHPARVEAFGVTVVEAMRAGIPPIVTNTTGAHTAVQQVSEELIIDSSTEAIEDAIIKYLDTPLSVRESLSSRARDVSRKYSKQAAQESFRKSFEQIIKSVASE